MRSWGVHRSTQTISPADETSAEIDRVRERFTYKFHNDGLMQISGIASTCSVVDLFLESENLSSNAGGVLDQVARRIRHTFGRRTPNGIRAQHHNSARSLTSQAR